MEPRSDNQSVAFITPTRIPLEAFTTFGINSKPNSSNPIGYFGTGLKYAVAVLLRLGARVRLFIGHTEYEFVISAKDFRGKSFSMIRLRRRNNLVSRWFYTSLPFSTELGKNWHMWQALRELESNTRDEGGFSKRTEQEIVLNDLAENLTTLHVTHPDFTRCYDDLGNIFLPEGLELLEQNSDVQAFNKPSEFLYYRGLRVHTLSKPSVYTYNFKCHMALTEDRTLAEVYMADYYLVSFLCSKAPEPMLDAVWHKDSKESWENQLAVDHYTGKCSPQMASVLARKAETKGYVPTRVSTYYGRYLAPAAVANKKLDLSLPSSFYSELIKIHDKMVEMSDGGRVAELDLADKARLQDFKKAVNLAREDSDIPF